MRDVKLGGKIAAGFGILIVICLGLGSFAVWDMQKVNTQSVELSTAYVPEVQVSSKLERHSSEAMRDVVAYAQTGDERFLKEGRENLDNVKQHLEKAKKHAARFSELEALKQGVDEAQKRIGEYEGLVGETESRNKIIAESRKKLAEASSGFLAHWGHFLNSQDQAMNVA